MRIGRRDAAGPGLILALVLALLAPCGAGAAPDAIPTPSQAPQLRRGTGFHMAPIRRIPGLEGGVFHLCIAPDGRRLGAVLGAGGLRVYDPDAGFQEVFADRDDGDQGYGCALGPDGSLVTSRWDGDLRLYRPQGSGLTRAARS